jgi:hypothetical protein
MRYTLKVGMTVMVLEGQFTLINYLLCTLTTYYAR